MFAFILSVAFLFTGLSAFINLVGDNETIGLVVGLGCLACSGLFAWLSTRWEG